jgi:DNA-binding FrmR family transcriptional regulator
MRESIPDHEHTHKNTRLIVNRLSRIEGHIRSIKTMVEEGRDCTDILTQIAAVRSAVSKVGKVVFEDHLESCLFHSGVMPEENDIWLGIKEAMDVYF